MSTDGALYIAYGESFVRLAAQSAASFMRHNAGCRTLLVTDETPSRFAAARFDGVEVAPFAREGFLDKVVQIARSPFERTLYLDADTYVCAPIGDIFSLLDRFDVAAAHAPLRVTNPTTAVPDCFPELNLGVIALRRTSAVQGFLEDWLAAYKRDLARGVWGKSDQPSFRECLFRSALRIATLPPEWNCRFKSPGYVHGSVRLLHSASDSPAAICDVLNADTRQRVHTWTNGVLSVTPTTRPAPDFVS